MAELLHFPTTGHSGAARDRHRIRVVIALTLVSFALASWPAQRAVTRSVEAVGGRAMSFSPPAPD